MRVGNNSGGGGNNWWAGGGQGQDFNSLLNNNQRSDSSIRPRVSRFDPNRAGSTIVGFDMAVSGIRTNAGALRRNIENIRNIHRDTGRIESDLINAFREMAGSFNNIISRAREVSGREASMLERGLLGMTQSFSRELRQIGISLDREGRMRIDRDRMQTAMSRGDVDRFLRGANSFMTELARSADILSRNPEMLLGSGFGGSV